MRLLVQVVIFLFLISECAWGQPVDSGDLAVRVQDLYRKAKTKKEIEGITLWCRDKIVSLNFKQHEALMLAAIRLMEKDDIEGANVFLKKAKAVDELSGNLGDLVCKKK